MMPAPTEFRWNEFNLYSATKHGCGIEEIERLVRFPPNGFPRRSDKQGRGTAWLVEGRGQGGRPMEVVFLMHDLNTAYVIHAQYLAPRGRRRSRSRRG